MSTSAFSAARPTKANKEFLVFTCWLRSSITLWIDPQWAPGIGNDRAGSGRGGSPILPPDGSGLSGWRPIESAAPAWLAAPRVIRRACRTDGEARSQVGDDAVSSWRRKCIFVQICHAEFIRRKTEVTACTCHDHWCSAGRIAAKPDIATAIRSRRIQGICSLR